MSAVPCDWKKGDRCEARGVVGVIDSIGDGCASVLVGERMLFVGLEELELVPLPEFVEKLVERGGTFMGEVECPEMAPGPMHADDYIFRDGENE